MTTRIVIDPDSGGRVFEGIGAVAQGGQQRLLVDYPERPRSEVLDALFLPAGASQGAVAAFQHVKVEIGGDGFSGEGAEASHMNAADDMSCDRGYLWWLMGEAQARNPEIGFDALAWTHPGWIGDDLYNHRGLDYVMAFIDCASRHAFALSHVGILNEDIRMEPEILERKYRYVKDLKRRLVDRRLPIGIAALDLFWDIVDAMAEDEELRDAVDAITVHYAHRTPSEAQELSEKWGKPLWSGEEAVSAIVALGESPETIRLLGEWYGGLLLARVLNEQYAHGKVTRASLVFFVCSYYEALYLPGCGLMSANLPWSGHYAIQPALWVVGHTTQFAQPGWRYLDPACGSLVRDGREVGTFVTRTDGSDWSLVVETGALAECESHRLHVAVNASDGFSSGPVHTWCSSTAEQFVHKNCFELSVEQGQFVFDVELEPASVYTFTTTSGQRKYEVGATAEPSRFPFPYAEGFRSSSVGNVPRYLATQKGCFELVDGAGADGSKCLMQLVRQPARDWITGNFDYDNRTWKPAPGWSIGEPYTIAGDLSWTDYRVLVSTSFDPEGASPDDAVGVLGRVQGGRERVYAGGRESAELDYRRRGSYELRLQRNGHWHLRRQAVDPLQGAGLSLDVVMLASGEQPPDDGNWRTLELMFRGLEITALIDGSVVAAMEDDSPDAHAHGMIGVTSSWHRARFAALTVEPVESDTLVIDDAEASAAVNAFEFRSASEGTWRREPSGTSTDHEGGHTASGSAGDSVVLGFEGRRVLLFGTRSTDGGHARVSLDGEEMGTIDFFREAQAMGTELVFTSPVLAMGTHMLEIEVLGSANPGSRGSVVRIDRADVVR